MLSFARTAVDFRRIQPKRTIRRPIRVEDCLAKTRTIWQDGSKITERGCDILTHLWTACRILQIFRQIWGDYPRGKAISTAALWLAAAHDIGKVSPGFVSKIYRALAFPLPWTPVEEEQGGHARSSEIALEGRFGSEFAHLAGCHHGGVSWRLGPQDSLENDILGGKAWDDLRTEILRRLQKMLDLPECDLKHLSETEKPLILGATVLADWLSSGMDIPYGSPLPDEKCLIQTIRDAGLLPVCWRTGLDFTQLFGFSANPLQKACQKRAESGAVYIIESGMGSGKTEAALSLAYQLLSQKRADGVYFSMPTKLTSEKIFDRLNLFLRSALADETPAEALLIHGDSWLDWSLPEEDGNGLETHKNGSWFQSKKRALLAPFAAGTVDQALLSVINVRHRALRAFALSGKVVILDEVHSYDSYTGSLIVSLVNRIREWGGTVIVLSATLTAAARARLLGVKLSETVLSSAYPLISIKGPHDECVEEIVIPEPDAVKITLRHTCDDVVAMNDALERAAKDEQVLWIENTVKNAQEVYRRLSIAADSNIELGLIHSRFPTCRRNNVEDRWVALLGRKGGKDRSKRGRILVATQVLEQSVDVDADYLITRLAPGDMLFQRLGRLWRHPSLNEFRPPHAKREALVLIPETYQDAESLRKHKGDALPYEPYWVWRTFLVWREMCTVTLPSDIRPLLERIYADEEETDAALELKCDMLRKREALERRALISQGNADAPDDDETATTRVNDRETVQVLLIRKGNCGFPLHEQISALFAETPIRIPSIASSARDRVTAVRALLRCMIVVPEYLAPKYEDFATEPFLGKLMWTGDESSRPIRAAYVDDSGLLLSQAGTVLSDDWYYHENIGYCATKKEMV